MTKKTNIELIRENLRKTVELTIAASQECDISSADAIAIIEAARIINVTIAKKEVDGWW